MTVLKNRTAADRPPFWMVNDQARRSAHCVLALPCGHITALDTAAFVVSAEGHVTPSVVCPVHRCPWHDFVRLDGWLP